MSTRSDRSDPGGRAGGLARVPLGATTLGVGRGLATESQKFHPGFFPGASYETLDYHICDCLDVTGMDTCGTGVSTCWCIAGCWKAEDAAAS